ncbi:MAG: hypothetical protein J1F07_03150 [Muribaculaceae bacterium]|nr:hypothetical protein [Muribaculaceae bacterium]
MAAILGLGFASCSNDLDSPALKNRNSSVLVKGPKIAAYSGDHYWGLNDNLSTRASDGFSFESCKTSLLDRNYEQGLIDEWLPEKNDNLKPGIEEDFLITAPSDLELEFYPIYSQTTTQNDLGVFYYDENGEYHEVIVWAGIEPWNLTETDYSEPVPDSWVEDPNHWSGEGGYYTQFGVTYSKGVKLHIPEGYKFGFYWKGHNNEGETKYYSDSSKNEEVYRTDGEGGKLQPETTSKLHAVTFELDGKTYLGLEDWTDFDYQDWVFTCDFELLSLDDEPGEQPGEGGNTGGDEKDDPVVTPEEPTTPPVVEGDDHTNEVEVNLAIDEKGLTSNGKYNESHLSIHVRSAVDVDIFIPMPLDLVCAADDMEIVKKHLEGEMEHGGEFTNATYDEDGKVVMKDGLRSKMTYKIADRWDVSIYVEFTNNPEEGIHIWTEGLANNTELMEYLQENYGDGITFEIWNYYDEDSTLGELKKWLDQATIEFIGNVLPDYFINAFGEENFNEGKDCDVNIVEEQRGNYEDAGVGPHLNASDHNKIWENKDRKNDPEPDPLPPVNVY